MFRTVWTWFCEASWRSWYAHALAACAMTYAPTALYAALLRSESHAIPVVPLPLVALWCASGALVFYVVREMGDELKHRGKGEWKKRANIDKVSWANDGKGDLVGPFSVWLAALAAYWVS